MTSENERAARYRVGGLRVIYDTGEGFWSGEVVDLSESGLFVETVHELAVGTPVTIMPDLPEEAQLPFEIHAEVARVTTYDLDEHFDRTPGIAFRLVGLDAEQHAQLHQFLSAHGVPVR